MKIQTAKLVKCKNQEIQNLTILYLSVHGTEWVDQKELSPKQATSEIAIVY